MRITVHHVTRYTFSEPASYSIQRLRLMPRSFEGQNVIDWQIDAPGIGEACRFRDAFGNEVHLVARTGPHDAVDITARGIVETSDRNGVVSGLVETAPARLYLRCTPCTRPDESLRGLAEASRGSDLITRLHDLMGRIRDRVEYETGTTDETTPAAQALAAGTGVCQDHAHIFITATRLLGVPARYVTGYLSASSHEAAEAHHAWAEALVPGLGWVGFDVANRLCPTDEYVRLACGLDASHAAPIRGSRRGGGAEKLDVEVSVAQQAAQQ